MSERLLRLATRIRDELAELERIVGRVNEGWSRALNNSGDGHRFGQKGREQTKAVAEAAGAEVASGLVCQANRRAPRDNRRGCAGQH